MSEKPKRKAKTRSSKRYQYDFLLSLVVFLASSFSCLFFFVYWSGSMFSGNELRGEDAKIFIEEHLNTELPENSIDYYINFLRVQGYTADMRFSAAPDDVEQWLDNVSFCSDLHERGKTETEISLGIGLTQANWWQADKAQRFTWYGQCGENPWYEVFIDKSDHNDWLVYISTGAD